MTKLEENKENQVQEKVKSTTKGYDDSVLTKPLPSATSYSLKDTRLKLPKIPRKGFIRQWVLETYVPEYKAKHWDYVYIDGKPMKEVMNSKTVETPEFGFYMEIPEHWYYEMRKAEDVSRKEQLQAISKNKHESADPNLKLTDSITNDLK